MPSDKEIEKIVYGAAAMACVGMSGDIKFCTTVFSPDFGDKLTDFLKKVTPASWWAAGVFDYWTISDKIIPHMQAAHTQCLDVVDEAWHGSRKQLGLEQAPSPARAYLQAWLLAEGWVRGGAVSDDVGASNKRYLGLPKDSAGQPWYYKYDNWPKVCNEDCQALFAARLLGLYNNLRLAPLKEGVELTLRYITRRLSHQWPLSKAIWVHGTRLRAERQDLLAGLNRRGWGTTVIGKPDSGGWFHLPITTTVLHHDKRLCLCRASMLFRTADDASARVTAVHLYDGRERFFALDGLDLAGDHAAAPDDRNSWPLDEPRPVNFGIGLSVHVAFGPASGTDHSITFVGAGADLTVP